MRLDIGEAIRRGLGPGTKIEITGGKFDVDTVALKKGLADIIAKQMGQNLYNGMRPDGSGLMPPRRKGGSRGAGSRIALAIAAVADGVGGFAIAAHREYRGHLKRILFDVPFRSPPLASLQREISALFARVVKTVGR